MHSIPQHHQLHHHRNHNSSTHHLPVSLVTSVSASFNYTSHLANNHHNSYNSSDSIHHPQPFTPPLHAVHPLSSVPMIESTKTSAFDYPSNSLNNYHTVKHLSPSPTQTNNSSCSIEHVSESLASPQSVSENGNNISSPSIQVKEQYDNGLLELLMHPEKCHEFLHYQVHNSIVFSPISHNGLDVSLPSWELLQVSMSLRQPPWLFSISFQFSINFAFFA